MTPNLPPLDKDPYALAYRYNEYMEQYPLHFLQHRNPYYKKLLANLPDPRPDAMADRSRAIRYAKDHYEGLYELKDIRRIVGDGVGVDTDDGTTEEIEAGTEDAIPVLEESWPVVTVTKLVSVTADVNTDVVVNVGILGTGVTGL
ncbi:hypothetical protein PtrSN002B_003380 [Pyrenophora tritici-repentis]|uniref:Uncharacterized protein n=1 Tax=Pyrenophora tritici-repentis TaxID=45151 RepID=A0A2W1DBF7_9PLEO|nr:hypothetical protein PtrV1_11256 [Pyrenophora tritici-repentis]KAF7566739.1 hypothetical protein PtrM4_150590 [Pyrenophora tritici-repentis]KAI1545407.1 hypothetical protein PtrSN001C_003217 [Pyrenophora tritici-repentis]KAI1555079.1 hypothetical protein PtrSN002B_003380 [Pyrenophora tritici-repentis]KAI1583100.1 hypothetical protein PtrEW7m1_003512 [Pyrenophora tritici-repentis]